jgi:hypothetical protein
MRRLTFGLMLALVASSAVGCTTCYSPFDHCYPTYTGAPGESCCGPRHSSILDANYGAYSEYEVEYGPTDLIDEGVIDEGVMPEATSEIPRETNARRTKLRPIPDRTTSRMSGPKLRR